MTEGTAKFFLLQVNDALFPIGGYSHSYGLETYIQKGIVHDEDSAEEFIHKRLEYNFLLRNVSLFICSGSSSVMFRMT